MIINSEYLAIALSSMTSKAVICLPKYKFLIKVLTCRYLPRTALDRGSHWLHIACRWTFGSACRESLGAIFKFKDFTIFSIISLFLKETNKRLIDIFSSQPECDRLDCNHVIILNIEAHLPVNTDVSMFRVFAHGYQFMNKVKHNK